MEGDCRSVEPIKSGRCLGPCSNKLFKKKMSSSKDKQLLEEKKNFEGCCKALRTKRRRVKMHCQDGGTKVSFVNIIRKCACKNECDLRRSLNLNAHIKHHQIPVI